MRINSIQAVHDLPVVVQRDEYEIRLGADVLTKCEGATWVPAAKQLAAKLGESVSVRRCNDGWPVARVTAVGEVRFF